jgi:phosphoglycerate dehydrogenase-like enzyme
LTRLLICAAAHADIAAEMARRAPTVVPLIMDDAGVVTVDGRPLAPDAVRPEIAWIERHAFLGPAKQAFNAAMLASPDLKWLHTVQTGVNSPIYAQVVAKGAALSNSHGQAGGVADYVLWGVLDHFQGGPARREGRAEKSWRPHVFREIAGTHWVMVGFGAIGQGVAARARGFGATITGVRRRQTADPLADRIAPLSVLPALAATADVLVLALPLSPATRHLGDARLFSAMKPGSVLVNVGRGPLVDEAALLAGLDAGTPGHALLDVFETEPLPADSPFWTHPRVGMTPHLGGFGEGERARNTALFLDNLERYLAGAPLINQVDPGDVGGD